MPDNFLPYILRRPLTDPQRPGGCRPGGVRKTRSACTHTIENNTRCWCTVELVTVDHHWSSQFSCICLKATRAKAPLLCCISQRLSSETALVPCCHVEWILLLLYKDDKDECRSRLLLHSIVQLGQMFFRFLHHKRQRHRSIRCLSCSKLCSELWQHPRLDTVDVLVAMEAFLLFLTFFKNSIRIPTN